MRKFKIVRGEGYFAGYYYLVGPRWTGWMVGNNSRDWRPLSAVKTFCVDQFHTVTGHRLEPGTWAWFSLKWEGK